MMTPALRMTKARTRLILEHPFFGTLAMRLNIIPEPSIETMDVDGITLRYSPTFLATLSDPELIGVLAHETMHCALLHVYRRGNRDPLDWNIAADFVINDILTSAGLTLPQGALIDTQYAGMSSEQVYAKRGSQPKPKGQGPGNGKPCPTGKFSDAPGPSNGSGKGNQPSNSPGTPSKPDSGSGANPSKGMSEQDWQVAAEQAAMVSRKAGKLPGGADRSIKQTYADADPWDILKQFCSATNPSDYSWAKPNRRYVANNIYLPGIVKSSPGVFVFAVDTSGSVDQKMLDCFAANISVVMSELQPERIHVVYCDAKVQHHESFGQGEEIQLHARGGGGTRFQPVFDWVEKELEAGRMADMKALIYLTDLAGDNPVQPDYPVLWVTPLWVNQSEPWGDRIKIDTGSE